MIIERAAKIARRLAGECDACDGIGEITNPKQNFVPYPDEVYIPCPHCARLREIAEWRWHEFSYGYVFNGDADSDYKTTQQSKMFGTIEACSCGMVRWSWNIDGDKEPRCVPLIPIHANPTLDIPALRELLTDLRLWKWTGGFIKWLWEREFTATKGRPYPNRVKVTVESVFKILTTLSLLKAEVDSFLKEAEG